MPIHHVVSQVSCRRRGHPQHRGFETAWARRCCGAQRTESRIHYAHRAGRDSRLGRRKRYVWMQIAGRGALHYKQLYLLARTVCTEHAAIALRGPSIRWAMLHSLHQYTIYINRGCARLLGNEQPRCCCSFRVMKRRPRASGLVCHVDDPSGSRLRGLARSHQPLKGVCSPK